MTRQSITSGQKERIAQFVIDELVSLGADKDSAQRIITKGGDLQVAIREQLLDLGAMRYKDEEVESSRVYPDGFAAKPICEQLLILAKHFPGLDPTTALSCAKQMAGLPEGAEGNYAIPMWQKVANSYNEALQKVFNLIAKTRPFKNWREGVIGPKYLKLADRTEKSLATLASRQNSDFLVVPAQLGMLHRGQSVRRVRETFGQKEFGLGSFAVACILLTHPERLVAYENLWIDCPGDEYSPDADGQFNRAPYFHFYDGKVRFHAHWVSNAREHYGSASGFLPQ